MKPLTPLIRKRNPIFKLPWTASARAALYWSLLTGYQRFNPPTKSSFCRRAEFVRWEPIKNWWQGRACIGGSTRCSSAMPRLDSTLTLTRVFIHRVPRRNNQMKIKILIALGLALISCPMGYGQGKPVELRGTVFDETG